MKQYCLHSRTGIKKSSIIIFNFIKFLLNSNKLKYILLNLNFRRRLSLMFGLKKLNIRYRK